MKTITTLAPLLLLIFACRLCSLSGNNIDPSKLNPYTGTIRELLPLKTNDGLIEFKFGTSTAGTMQGATEARQANYTMQAGSISTSVQLQVANFSSAEAAREAMQAAAEEKGATLASKTKAGETVGKRFTDQEGKAIVWSNGSLMCIAYSQFAKTTSNFEESLPF